MDDKQANRDPNLDEKTRRNSSSSSTAADENPHRADLRAKATDSGVYQQNSEINNDSEIEVAVSGHDLDVELGHIADNTEDKIEELKRVESRASVKTKISKVFSIVSRKKTREKERIAFAPIPTSDLDQGIVGWDSQDDPSMPLNYKQGKKWLIVGLVSAATFLTPFASSILAPGIGSLNEEFHNDNEIVGTLTVSIYLLGYCLGPLFLAPLSEIYGRRPVLAVSNIFFCVWQIGCALAPSISSLIVFRFFTGVGGSGCLTLGAGVIADVFRTDERGFAIGIYTLGPLIGPTLGPVIGGFLSQSIGWRWDFWIVLIAGSTVTALIEIFNSETNHHVLMQRKVKRLQRELGRDDLRSCYEVGTVKRTHTEILLNGLTRPTKMLFLSPIVLAVSVYIAFTYGVLYLLFTTIPPVFMETYGWGLGVTGLVYISLGLGNFSGWGVVTLTSDKGVVERTKANNGVFEPEMRLPICIYFSIILPITFFWYGWSADKATHWIVPVIGLFPFSFGLIGIFLPLLTYLVDCYPMYAASAVAANTVLRSLVGMLLPLAGPQMYATLGLGWGNSLLGFLCILMIPVPLFIHRYGARLRKKGLQL
ncbi:major facilitator superfamily domain-containing protein [Lasiosphaeria ovina]|uniref:Major facilitator superfamily domain-containing protein n=1 Tax=Lasiosphaeria ovina TaxID=92902 RepID=A0AAE0N4D0_9PEZI|nr:major facilitator superfamily domain-containing protein [Lasiosphaeria ovina]